MYEPILCETCGKPTNTLGKRCDVCWNTEHLLPTYLKSPGGQTFARKHMPLLDDWADGKPDAWDYDKVLADNEVKIEWCDKMTADGVTFEPCPPDLCGWGFYWVNGAIHIGQTSEVIARKAAALFVSLWLRGVSASFADNLMDGYVCYLERQENMSLTFLAEIDHIPYGPQYFRLTREGYCNRASFARVEEKIINTLDVQPDEEIIVTFTKRKKQP